MEAFLEDRPPCILPGRLGSPWRIRLPGVRLDRVKWLSADLSPFGRPMRHTSHLVITSFAMKNQPPRITVPRISLAILAVAQSFGCHGPQFREAEGSVDQLKLQNAELEHRIAQLEERVSSVERRMEPRVILVPVEPQSQGK